MLAIVRMITFPFKQVSIMWTHESAISHPDSSGPSSRYGRARGKDEVIRFAAAACRRSLMSDSILSVMVNALIPLCPSWDDFEFVARLQVLNFQ